MPTVKLGGESVIVWGCLSAGGPDKHTITVPTLNSTVKQMASERNGRPSVKKDQEEEGVVPAM